jgi:hypothetical protein
MTILNRPGAALPRPTCSLLPVWLSTATGYFSPGEGAVVPLPLIGLIGHNDFVHRLLAPASIQYRATQRYLAGLCTF